MADKKMHLRGVDVEVVSNAAIEEGPASFLLCAPATEPLMMADNLVGECTDCAADVQYRPHAPKVPRVCLACGTMRLRVAREPLTLSVTTETLAEVEAYDRRQQN